MDLLAWVVVGFVAGAIARWIVKDERRGCLYTIGVGVLGALIGGGLVRAAGWDNTRTRFGVSVLTAIVGAVLLLLVLQALAGRGPRRPPPRR
ncbi:MAG: GlsB/YeaQ/YmgE family stress response membrane protein [Ilumatobacteraceae bacterium]|nr:GlsB/YeaQ/YmgE family stress response membrane protein [Acidimicrobiales bacterium]MCB9396126.1 GlsB/YeaQ/YmgE family stress response membrane protein [Acidimicrobiaceae bacterium]